MLKRSRTLLFLVAATAFVAVQAGDVRAQQQNTSPYEADLLRLSEIIGSVHFLSLICAPEDGLIWHEKMQEMIEAEGTTELRRAKLVERFNSGFSGFQATYQKCTPSAETVRARFLEEAEDIVLRLTRDFGS
ncbi:MAG: TIGR02301 family protein [Pseudomonadota bacterium]